MLQRTTIVGLAAVAMLAACAAEPSFSRAAVGDPVGARRALEAQLRSGPVPLEVRGRSPIGEDRLAGLAATGIEGITASFATGTGKGRRRLVLSFGTEAPGSVACRTQTIEPASAEGPPRLVASYCDGEDAIASIGAVAADESQAAAERLVWRTTAKLFPDTYADDYGLNIFGLRVTVGGSISR